MSQVVPVLPYLIDPIGAATGVGVSPGGALKNAITPPRPSPSPAPAAPPRPVVPPPPALPALPPTPKPQVPAAKAPPEVRKVDLSEKAGAGGNADVTRGLLAARSKRSLLG